MPISPHYKVKLDAGMLSKVAWGGNALQTITIARHFPRNPQQAVGLKGIVDYTNGVRTSDVTLDCILTEQSDEAVASEGSNLGTSVYKHAERELLVGQESYVMSSCNVVFPAGAPATVAYGWLTAGIASALDISANPDLLIQGEEAAFAVVMGKDGGGVVIAGAVLPSGIQNISFNSSINHDNVLDVRSTQPVQFVTTYPIDITGSIETRAGVVLPTITTLTLSTGAADGADIVRPSKKLVVAQGMSMTEDGENMNVGGYLTFTRNFTVANLCIPLTYV